MLYSQINYVGSILPIPDNYTNIYTTLFENFTRGNLKISKQRIFSKVENGGLGLFDIDNYLNAQRCNWLKKASLLDEHWKIKLYSKSLCNVFELRKNDFCCRTNPILFTIANSCEILTSSLARRKEHIKEARVFDNRAVFREIPQPRRTAVMFFNETFFGDQLMAEHLGKIYKLRVKNFFSVNGLLSYQSFLQNTGLPISNAKYLVLRDACNNLMNRYKKETRSEKISQTTEAFICRVKKGSKHIRNTLEKTNAAIIPHNMVKFAETTEIVVGSEAAKNINAGWSLSYLTNEMKVFLFNLQNNTLTVNSRLAHFVRDQSPECTFCLIRENEEQEDETVLHLFWQCPAVENVITELVLYYILDDDIRGNFSRQMFFCRPDSGKPEFDKFTQTFFNIIKKDYLGQ
jgi:hypothetical protein